MEITASLVGLVLEAAPDALIGADADGRIVLVNRRAEQLFGRVQDELLGTPLDALLRDVPPVPAVHDRAGAPGRPSIGPVVQSSVRRKDGSDLPAEVAFSFVDAPQGVLLIASVREVPGEATREQAAEIEVEHERALARQGASQRLQSLGYLAVGAAHDFNNMLSVIINYTGFVVDVLARGDVTRADLDETRRDLGQAMLAAEQAAVLTRQLLTFGRRGVAERRPVSVNEVIEGIEQLIRSLGAQAEFEMSLGRDLPLVEADPGDIEQVVVDLTIRARGALPDGGVLQIRTDAIEAREVAALGHLDLRPGPYLRLRVSGRTDGAISTHPASTGTDDADLRGARALASQASGVVLIDTDAGGITTVTVLWPTLDQAPA